jgi:hypothetical protein
VESSKVFRLPPEYSIDAGTSALSPRRDTVEVPVFWIVLLLSMLLHVAVLYFVPPLRLALRPASDPQVPLAVELELRRPALEARESVPQPAFIPPVAIAPRTTPPRPLAPAPRT